MDTWIDLNTQTHYEVKQSWEQKETQDIFNSALEKNEKLRNFIIKWIKNDLLNNGWTLEATNTSYFWISENIWLQIYRKSWNWHIYKYSKENWLEFVASLYWLKNDEFLEFAERESWYDLDNWKLSKDWKEVIKILSNWNINSEYIKWINNINFFTDLQWVFWMIKTLQLWEKLEKLDLWYFERTIIWWTSRIKEVLYFKQHWYISDEDFPQLLIRAIKELPNQSSDTRFYKNAKWERMWMEVTKQELSQYLKPKEWEGLITQEMYDQCIKLIDRRNELIRKKEEAKESTKWNLKIEKEKKTVLDKISDLLGW